MNLIGKTLVICDIAVCDLPHVNEYEIESYKIYNYIQLKDYPTKTYLFNKQAWNNLVNGKQAWIHIKEVFCYIRFKNNYIN